MVSIFMIIAGILLLWTIFNSFFLPELTAETAENHPFVSVLVPLRNEERNVTPLVDSLKRIEYAHAEFILLDDQSEDETYNLLLESTKNDTRFRIVQGEPLQEGWNGKVYACHQLSSYAKGEHLFFVDADVRVSSRSVEKFLSLQQRKQASFISGFPSFRNSCLLGHLLVPMQHFVINLHLPLFMANKTNIPMFTAAFGGCLFIDRKAYDEIGGHTRVHDSLVEDVHLAKEMKHNRKRSLLANVTSDICCRMYETNREVWNGFKKNIFPGLGRSISLAVSVIILYTTLFLVPFVMAFITGGMWWFICATLIGLKLFIDLRTRHPWWVSFFLPLSVLSMLSVLISSILVDRQSKKYKWKGRSYL
ncbi:glycosyltransferase [Salimicrobium flavidum]|uniref:Glycosyltransferase, catalytic subunit of cellulose synthase and poly-beta-1,6-N-acetylglucosamine synthase n=1 Tax=Salimicrobium flavidum TaxID=570947 RepID=A0A1N7IMI1_9BACI|nr:glycosyltransferase family 2 protein [Salimicrobium flavidum]SIS38262.1 Glycosyltransferase, catalytic subunit of cellulose synthase and poly-beta-1,6-N-acetylglucosamine synthase [Salimicrobium flavidum]